MSKPRIVAAASAGILGLAMMPATASAQEGIVIDPTSGPAGTTINVSGGDCFPFGDPLLGLAVEIGGSSVEVGIAQTAHHVQLTVAHATTGENVGSSVVPHEALNDDGTWSGSVTVGTGAQPGDYDVRADCVNDDFTTIGAARFVVQDDDDDPGNGEDPPDDGDDPPDGGIGGPGETPPTARPGDTDPEPGTGDDGEDDEVLPAPAPPAPAMNGSAESKTG